MLTYPNGSTSLRDGAGDAVLHTPQLHKRIYYGWHCLYVENLLLNGCSKSFKNHLLFWGKWNIKYGESISCPFSYMYLFLMLKLLVYFTFHLCSSLFTMFESTKLIYLRQCIFIHLYFYFCTVFLGGGGVFVVILYHVCKIFVVIYCCYNRWKSICFLKQWWSASLTQHMWTCAELACGPAN